MKRRNTYLNFPCILAVLALSACASAPTKTTMQLQDILRAERPEGQTPACTIPEDLKGQDHTAIAARQFDVPIRVIFPGSAVTEDHIANRLNFNVNAKGTITSITCG